MPTPLVSSPDSAVLLATKEVARLLGVEPQTLRKWRILGSGRGPRYVRLGGRVAYRRADLDEWIAARTFASTAEESVIRAVTTANRNR